MLLLTILVKTVAVDKGDGWVTAWVSNPRSAMLCYATRGQVCELCITQYRLHNN